MIRTGDAAVKVFPGPDARPAAGSPAELVAGRKTKSKAERFGAQDGRPARPRDQRPS